MTDVIIQRPDQTGPAQDGDDDRLREDLADGLAFGAS
jgi:hypothetical protein